MFNHEISALSCNNLINYCNISLVIKYKTHEYDSLCVYKLGT